MKTRVIPIWIILLMIVSVSLKSQQVNTFKHPEFKFSFEAPGQWDQNTNHKDENIYEVVDKAHEIHVMLQYTGGTESSCEKYLLKMADMKNLRCNEVKKIKSEDKIIMTLEYSDQHQETEQRRIIAAMSHKKAYTEEAPERTRGKSYNAIHVAQIWCPESRYAENEERK